MRKIFLKYYEHGYGLFEKAQTMNFDLQYLWGSFHPLNDEYMIDEENGWITIWKGCAIKDQKQKSFISFREKQQYEQEYKKYWLKLWEEIPKLEISKENYNQLKREWELLNKNPKKYVILSIDSLNCISLEAKDDLSEQDLQDLEKEHQIYLHYKQKYDAYRPFLKGKNYEWESSNDDEYYSDFLTEDEIVWKKKKF